MKTDKYITGKYALNIHHPQDINEPTGDWHGYIWDGINKLPDNKVTYAGNGFKINTFHIWDDFGIYDDTDNLRKMGISLIEERVYVADYYRAILDLIYLNLFTFNNLVGLNYITYDHLDNNKQVMIVLKEIGKLKNHVNNDQLNILKKWVNSEIVYGNK